MKSLYQQPTIHYKTAVLSRNWH